MMGARGVPTSLAKDGWWLEDDTPVPRPLRVPGLLALGCVVLADFLLWNAAAGLGLVVLFVVVAGAIQITLWPPISTRRAVAAWAILIVALAPMVELVQVLSVFIAVAGLLAFAVLQALGRWDAPVILRAILRLPGAGIRQLVKDMFAVRVAVPAKLGIGSGLRDWILPLAVGAIFVALMGAANPIVDGWLTALGQFDASQIIQIERFIFWTFAGLAIWPLLRLPAVTGRLGQPARRVWPQWRSGLVTPRSILRALVMFNLIFAVQSLTDLGYLWGGVRLPDGMTYADYAHRGAYPLMGTALLAGVFALIAQPHLDRPVLRMLLYVWIAQTVLLVVSSILRLDLYVDAYGLTRLRFFAFVWMAVVALGLMLILMQMWGRESTGWFMLRASGLGVLALYAVSLVNVDGLVARTQMARALPDLYYICNLGDGAAVVMQTACGVPVPDLSAPADWREWGYRNARLRHSLAQMSAEVQQ